MDLERCNLTKKIAVAGSIKQACITANIINMVVANPVKVWDELTANGSVIDFETLILTNTQKRRMHQKHLLL